MVKIQLDEKYWLKSDNSSWQFGEWRISKGDAEPKFQPKGYFTTLSHALQGYYDLSLRNSQAESWEDLRKDADLIKIRIKEILERLENAEHG